MTATEETRSRQVEQTIPVCDEAEESLLGAMLLSGGAVATAITAGVTLRSFHRPEFAVVFDSILAASANGGVDPVTVAAHSCGVVTPKRVAEIQAATPASANAPAYAALVLGAARRRDLLGLASELAASAREGGDVGAVISRIVEVRAEGRSRMTDGRAFVLDRPDHPPMLCGPSPDAPLWQRGESLLIVGPTGVGKTTLETQFIAASLGVLDGVLGCPVEPADRVLLIAADRPQQIGRAMTRLFGLEDSDVLAERFCIWQGPPPRDFARYPDTLIGMARDVGATRVFIDSLKDVAIGLSDDEVGSGLNRALQTALAEGVDVCALHHQRKGRDGSKPKGLEDVYGSTWITAGAGSVVLLWGEAGDPIVDLVHLKQPGEAAGPWRLEHDHDSGISIVLRGQADPLVMLRHAPGGLTARDVARVLTEKADPTENEIRTARRKLDRLVTKRRAHRRDPEIGGAGGTQPTRYFAVVADLEEGQ